MKIEVSEQEFKSACRWFVAGWFAVLAFVFGRLIVDNYSRVEMSRIAVGSSGYGSGSTMNDVNFKVSNRSVNNKSHK